MTHPEIALETTAEERAELVAWNDPIGPTDKNPIASGITVATKENVILAYRQAHPDYPGSDQEALEDFMTVHWAWFEPDFKARVADAERAGRIKGLEEALGAVSLVIGFHGEACPSTEAAAAIRSLIPDPETKEDDNGCN